MTHTEIKSLVMRFQSVLALSLLVLALSLATDRFLTVDNTLNVLRQISINVCLSIGMTMIILSGGIDLSVGSILALSGAIAAGLMKNGVTLDRFGVQLQFTVVGGIVAGIVVGTTLGLCNGLAITRFRLPPFVATLGMLSIARGLTMLWTGGFPITSLGDEFGKLGTGYFLGIPMPVCIAAVLVGIFVVVTERTRFGRYLYAIGGNERAAQLSGIDVPQVKLCVYACGGLLSGIAGLLVTSRLDSATPNAGTGYELDSIAAVVIGGTSLSGGRGSIWGTLLGCLIIGVLNNGMVLLEVSPFWQQVVKGVVIIFAVAIERANRNDR
ncbi:MAG: ABC transporter permease [Bythopirellula sp.]|nr:ABC transporter permease [Bythopirellula sp.]